MSGTGAEHGAAIDDPNVTDTRRRVGAEDSVRMRELAERIQAMTRELGELTKSYTDLDDDERTVFRFTPNGPRGATDDDAIYIEIVDGWHHGVPRTACFVYCHGKGPAVSYVENPCGSGPLMC